MTWIDPKEELPPQGYKVLCCDRGDYYVAQRFKKMWLQIPFTDSQFATSKRPEKWTHIHFHGKDKGYLLFKVEDDETYYTLDEMEKDYPEAYDELITGLAKGKLGKHVRVERQRKW